MNARDALDAEMAALLGQLSVCSNTAASGYGVRGARSDEHPGGRRPPGDLDTEDLARRYGPPFHICTSWCSHRARPAENDDQRRQVIKAARDELTHLRGYEQRTVTRDDGSTRYESVPLNRPVMAGETLDQLKARIVKEGEGFTVKQVAQAMRCGERIVMVARRDAGREPDLGKAPAPEADAEARRARAQQLADDGFTLAQIARLLDVHRSTIERDLGRGGRSRAA